jgi:hypothetical protein
MSVVTQADLEFAAKLQAMPDEEFLQAWQAAITASAFQQIALVESAATHRFGTAAFQQAYVARFPVQTYYPLPTKLA